MKMTESKRPKLPADDTTDEFHAELLDIPEGPWLQNGTPPLEDGPDPFDPERLRLTPETSSAFELKRPLLTVPVRRPAPHWFFRTHRDNRYHLPTVVLELKEEREIYLVDPCVWNDVAGLPCIQKKILVSCINRQQKFFFWPIRTPDSDGRRNDWISSAIEAARIAKETWIRLESDMALGAYEVAYAEHLAVEPAWPDLDLNVLLRIAFRDRHIDHLGHTVLQQLRGRE
jgi:hypothetical protein